MIPMFALAWLALSPALSGRPSSVAVVAQTGHARLSPFEMVRWNGVEPEVLVRGAWWRLEAIDGVSCESILASARQFYGDDWPKRFCEDLVEVLTRSGHAPGAKSELRLAALTDSKASTLSAVEWTAANRQRILAARPRPGMPAGGSVAPVLRVERERARGVPTRFEPLVRRLDLLEAQPDRLTRAQLAQDLEQLEWLVANAYSYRDRTRFDWRAAFDALHAQPGESISRASFALQVHRLLCEFGDGHSRLRLPTAEVFAPGALPVRLARDEHGVVALDARGGALDVAHPYLFAIDGETLDTWLVAARALVPRGSTAFEDRGALRRVVHVPHLRAERGKPARDTALLALSNRAGERVEREVAFVRSPVRAAEGEILASRRLPGDIGYLRIGRMDDEPEFLARLEKLLDELAGVRGLVIDVRGNGGGSRQALLSIAPRLVPRAIDALVVNVAALRVVPGEDATTVGAALRDRFLYPSDSKTWSPAAQRAVTMLAAGFAPATPLPAGEFTPWHYLVLERDARPEPITNGRVAVLLDEGCFSATDVFLGALAEFPNVTLVGMPSGGGSGRARGHVLAHSGLEVQLSTMASFRPDGSPYDGRGIEPDVRIAPTLDDFVGRKDTALERAAQLVRER